MCRAVGGGVLVVSTRRQTLVSAPRFVVGPPGWLGGVGFVSARGPAPDRSQGIRRNPRGCDSARRFPKHGIAGHARPIDADGPGQSVGRVDPVAERDRRALAAVHVRRTAGHDQRAGDRDGVGVTLPFFRSGGVAAQPAARRAAGRGGAFERRPVRGRGGEPRVGVKASPRRYSVVRFWIWHTGGGSGRGVARGGRRADRAV